MTLHPRSLPSMLLLLAVTWTGCAALDRTRPHDMTVAEHERAAREGQAKAAAAVEQARGGGRGAPWQRSVARRQASLSTEHAEAARQLEREVTAACPAGTERLPAVLSELPVSRVEPIREAEVPPSLRSGRGYYPERLRGARLLLSQGAPDRDVLVAALGCAHFQALAGTVGAEARSSPFVIRGAKLTVAERDRLLSVEIRAPRTREASEVLRRARLLASAGTAAP